MSLYIRFTDHLNTALDALVADGDLPADAVRKAVTVEPPRDPSHGDLATNAAMVLAKGAGMKPRDFAEKLAEKLRALDEVVAVDIAGPGFINLRLSPSAWINELHDIAAAGEDYGRPARPQKSTVNVEYVSANPTGPMHMGHCRGAVVGDALASLLEFAGHTVTREYYVNDAGGQVDVLARSVHLRYLEALGRDIGEIPNGLYPGDYLIPLAKKLSQEYGEQFADMDEAGWLTLFREKAVVEMLNMIRDDLALLGIHHDVFASEAVLQAAGKPAEAEVYLRAKGLIYDGVLEAPKGKALDDWEAVELPLFRSTQFGDDQDRPIKKSDGKWTYFGADMAYHFQKAQKADALINIWGADHAGTVKRIKAAVSALTDDAIPFDVKLVQMVRLLRNGEPVKMSKRAGDFVTLAEVIDEVGKDVVRFTMLTRKADAQMDFDFSKVVEASKDNPVFYVQYAHARICSTLRKAEEQGLTPSAGQLGQLTDADFGLVRLAAQFPRIIEAAAQSREPHRVAFYLYDLAAAYHAFWNLGNDQPDKRVLRTDAPELSGARLFMSQNIRQILHNGLNIMGVEAAQSM